MFVRGVQLLQKSVFTCERNPRVSTSTATVDPHQDIRVGKSCYGDFRKQSYNSGISEKRLPTQERKPNLFGESLCGKVYPLTRKTSKCACWKELFGRGKR